jgi:hypothetical protein
VKYILETSRDPDFKAPVEAHSGTGTTYLAWLLKLGATDIPNLIGGPGTIPGIGSKAYYRVKAKAGPGNLDSWWSNVVELGGVKQKSLGELLTSQHLQGKPQTMAPKTAPLQAGPAGKRLPGPRLPIGLRLPLAAPTLELAIEQDKRLLKWTEIAGAAGYVLQSRPLGPESAWRQVYEGAETRFVLGPKPIAPLTLPLASTANPTATPKLWPTLFLLSVYQVKAKGGSLFNDSPWSLPVTA